MSSEEPDDGSPEDENGIKILSSGSAESDDDQDRSDSDGANTPESGVVVEGSGEESSEEYRRRVYGDGQECSGAVQPTENQGMRRLSRQFSQSLRRSSSIVEENLPKTPSGWAILSSVLASCLLGYEVRLQKSLTCPPIVYAQYNEGPMKELYRKLTESEDSILRRSIQPSLFVGTRAYMSSTAAYLLGGPSRTDEHIQFREIINLTLDGGKMAMEWELPVVQTTESKQERIQRVLKGSIDRPVVVVIHGINNHANFGYIRSMMRVCTDRGWIAAGMNLRGCGGMPLATPRGYNAAYTGDIRCVVQTLEARLAKGVPIFLVGNSLSASLVTKYLGEEGLSGTLPRCVAGGAALGLPASMNATNMSMIFSPLLSLGAKKTVLQNWGTIRHLNDEFTRKCIKRALTSVTLAQFDEALAPVMVRNDPIYPFAYRVGFKGTSTVCYDTCYSKRKS